MTGIDIAGEIWRDIPGFPGYQVSNMGRVKSLGRIVSRSNGVPMTVKSRILRPYVHKGYQQLTLRADGESHKCMVYELVLLAFIGQRPDGMEICHFNGVRNDDRLENLRYDTRSANMLDKRRHGTAKNTFQASKTHCAKGHPYDEENTSISVTAEGYKMRSCRICRRLSVAKHKRRKLAERKAARRRLSPAYSLELADLLGEEWLDIPGFEGQYQASNIGRIKSLPRKAIRGRRDGWHKPVRERMLMPHRNELGYLRVRLSDKKSHFVHKLVMLTFVGPRPDGMEVCHFNGNKEDNSLENLRYDTRQENMNDLKRRKRSNGHEQHQLSARGAQANGRVRRTRPEPDPLPGLESLQAGRPRGGRGMPALRLRPAA